MSERQFQLPIHMVVSSLPDILADRENGKAEIQSPVVILRGEK